MFEMRPMLADLEQIDPIAASDERRQQMAREPIDAAVTGGGEKTGDAGWL